MQGRLFGLMAIGKKESSQMDHKIGGCVGYLGDPFEHEEGEAPCGKPCSFCGERGKDRERASHQSILMRTDLPSGMLLRSSEEDESLREPESHIEELSWTYEGSSQHRRRMPRLSRCRSRYGGRITGAIRNSASKSATAKSSAICSAPWKTSRPTRG